MPKFNIGDKVRIKYRKDRIGYIASKECNCMSIPYYRIRFGDSISKLPWYENEIELLTENNKEDNTMTMPKLETGMIVINKHDKVGVVAGNEIWYNDGEIDDVKEVLMYLERNKFDGYIKYIIKNRRGFYYIQHNLPNIKADKPVSGIEILWKYEEPIPEVTLDEVYQKFGHKVKIIDQQ